MKNDKKENCMEENVNNIIENAMENLKNIVEVNTIVGKPISLQDGIVLVPVSKVNVGFVAGGGEIKCDLKKIKSSAFPFSGGSGSGFTINPVGFIVIKEGEISYINVDNTAPYKDIFKLTDKIISKILNNKEKQDEE